MPTQSNSGKPQSSTGSIRHDSGGAPGPKKTIPCPPKPNTSKK